MSPAKHYFDVLWFHLASIYHQIIDDIGRRREPSVSLWGDFKAGTVKVLSWVDLVSAANLRWRAMHTKVILPDEQGALHIPDIAMISDQNLWVHLHREITSPLIEARAKWMLEQEQIYLEKKRQAIESWMKDPQPEHTPMHRLDRVQRDAMTEIANVSEQVQLSDPRVSDAFPFAEYHTREDRRVRPTHAAMSGFVAARSWQGWPLAVPPCGFNCFLPGTFVEGSFSRGFKARYDGPAVELEIGGGQRLRVTANHPIFTPNGWIAAGSLKKGDTLLCDSSMIERVIPGSHNKQNAPALAEDVFNALGAHGVSGNFPPMSQKASSPLDFYGDARSFVGNVDVVGPERELMLNSISELSNLLLQGKFIFSAMYKPLMSGFGALHQSLERIMPSLASLPCGGALAANGSWIGPYGSPFLKFGLASAPDSHAVTQKELANRRSFTAQFPGQCFEGDAGVVSGDNGWSIPSVSRRYGAAAHWNISASQSKMNKTGAHAQFIRDLIKSSAGSISPRRLLNIKRFDFSGHVYDFQSDTGWILSDGIVASNCRCYLIFIARFEARQRGWLDKHDRPKFELRWPNSLAEANWNDGKFPEWKTPRFWAFPGSKAAA